MVSHRKQTLSPAQRKNNHEEIGKHALSSAEATDLQNVHENFKSNTPRLIFLCYLSEMNVSSEISLLWFPPAPLGKFKGQKRAASPWREIVMDLGDLGLLQNWENCHANNKDVITTILICRLRANPSRCYSTNRQMQLFSKTALTLEPR